MPGFIDTIERARDKISEAKDRIAETATAVVNGTTSAVQTLIDDTDGPLVGDNRAVAESIFGDSLDYDAVTLNDSSFMADVNQHWNNGSRPFVLGNTVNSQGPLTQEELIHELTHVWQYQTGGLGYIVNSISDNTYKYNADSLATNSSMSDYNAEQQAEIVSHYFVLNNETRPLIGELKPHNMVDANGDQIVITESNIDQYIDDLQPYIDEVRTTPAQEGLARELNEAPVEIIREGGEGVEEVVGEVAEGIGEVSDEIRDGDIPGALYETGEGVVETTYEAVEGVAETGYEVVEGTIEIGVEGGKDAVGWIKNKIPGL